MMKQNWSRPKNVFVELETLLADEKVLSDSNQYGKLAKEFSNLGGLIELYRSYQKTLSQIRELQEIVKGQRGC